MFSSFPSISRITLLCLLALTVAPAVFAEGDSASPTPVEMEVVTVTGAKEDNLTGGNTLDRAILDHLPARNGSLNEALGILPGVQLPEQGRTSLTAGEIAPPNVSISGGKIYQNNFLIDGFSNNNLMDPEADNPTSFTLVPSHPQSLFLDTDLIEKIDVYRYNVPARFGNFTGGVVDARTLDPGPEFWGKATYRTTRHEWTQFHVDPTIKEAFENSTSQKYQPEFEKHDIGLTLNLPLTPRLSLLTSYQLNYSRIAITHLLEEENLDRKSENFFAKLAFDIDPRTRLTATVQHAPYHAEYVYPNSLGSEFSIDGGGDQVGLTFEQTTDWGRYSLSGALKASESSRDATGDFYTRGGSTSKPWGTSVGTTTPGYPTRTGALNRNLPSSIEGSVGSLETSQSGFEILGDVLTEPVTTGPLVHRLNAGFAIEQATGMMKRDNPHNSYTIPVLVNSSFLCPIGLTGCIDGEQFMSFWQQFPADKVRATVNFIDGYLEDHITLDRLELRPGVRISYDDFMENTNISPRLAAGYDLFGDDRTVLTGGINRYYGRTLLAYKLREASIPSQNYVMSAANRRTGTPSWPATPTSSIPYRYSELDPPYTDELVLGLDQELLGGRLRLTGLKREGRDEFAQETYLDPLTGKRSYQLTNRGESHHKEASLEWERSWSDHYLSINVTWQETESTNEEYSSSVQETQLSNIYWYDGDYVTLDELPRSDFNRNWTGNLIYSAKLPLGVIFTNVTRYRSGYDDRVILNSAERAALGISPSVTTAFKNEEFPEALVFDWRIDWDMYRDQSLVVSVEVNNVFDEEVALGDATNQLTYQNYELGRQFWLGLTYKF